MAFSLLALVFAIEASAYVQVGKLEYQGTGCLADSVRTQLSSEQGTLSVVFDDYGAESGRHMGTRLDRKTCDLVIPIQVASGYSVAIRRVEYKGYNMVPAGGEVRFNASYLWLGEELSSVTRVFAGPYDDQFSVADESFEQTLVWTACGAQVHLSVNSSVVVRSSSRLDQAASVFESEQGRAGIVYSLEVRSCN